MHKYIKKIRKEVSPSKKATVIRHHKVGVLLAFVKDGIPYFGWSLVNEQDGDVFDREIGLEQARKRAIPVFAIGYNQQLPFKVKRELPSFMANVSRYLKVNIPGYVRHSY